MKSVLSMCGAFATYVTSTTAQEPSNKHKHTNSLSKYTWTMDCIVSPICTSSKNCSSGATLVVSPCSDGLYDVICSIALYNVYVVSLSRSGKGDTCLRCETRGHMPIAESLKHQDEEFLDGISHSMSIMSRITCERLDPLQRLTISVNKFQRDIERE